MMEAAGAIIAISNYTRNEILRIYPQYADKTHLVYHGLPNEEQGTPASLDTPERFILFVGGRSHYKNFAPMATALAPLLNKDKNLELLCTGGGEFTTEEEELLEKFQLNRQCRQFNATDEELKLLYQRALVFVYPSSQEGFGLPMLEAFRNNCPIACSNASCLPEIGGDAASYFEPENAESLLNAVEKIINDTHYANQLRAKGQERLTHFTMQSCIENTVKVYRKLLH